MNSCYSGPRFRIKEDMGFMRSWHSRSRQLLLGVDRFGGTGWPGLCSLQLGCLPFGTLSPLRLRKEFWEVCHWYLLWSLSIALSPALVPPPILCQHPQLWKRWMLVSCLTFSSSRFSWKGQMSRLSSNFLKMVLLSLSFMKNVAGSFYWRQKKTEVSRLFLLPVYRWASSCLWSIWGETQTLSWVWSFSKAWHLFLGGES